MTKQIYIRRKTRGRDVHKQLTSFIFKKYKDLGYNPEIEKYLKNKTRADVFIKANNKKIVIECLVKPTLTLVKNKLKIYKNVCDEFIIAYPSYYITNFPIESFCKVILVDISEKFREEKLGISMTPELKNKAKSKAALMGLSLKDYIIRLIEINTQNMFNDRK